MTSFRDLRLRTETEKDVLFKALALASDKRNVAKQAELALALEALDHERSSDVVYAVLKSFPPVGKNVLSMSSDELAAHVNKSRVTLTEGASQP
jgi:hypothetical protein